MNPRRLTALALTALTAFGLTACSAIGDKVSEVVVEKAIEAGGGGKVDIDADGEGGLRLELDGGGTVTFGNTDLPEGWPSGLSVPDGLEIASAYSATSADSYTANVVGTLPGSFEDAVAAGEQMLGQAGFTATGAVQELDMEGLQSWSASAEDGSSLMRVNVMNTGDEAPSVIISLEPLNP